jgi:hypothetical protein
MIGLHLSKQQFNAIRGPGRDACTENVRVFRPNRTFECKCRGQHRPILFITFLQPLPRRRFKWPVHLGIDAADQNSQLSEHGESGFRFNTPLQQNSGKVLPCFGGREESDSRGMCFENLSNTLAQDCANQYVRVENSSADLPAATACFLEIVHQFVFSGPAGREKRVELCRGCP